MIVKQVFWSLAVAVCITMLSGCWQRAKPTPEKQSGLIVVNVLDKADYDDCHIKGSIQVPFDGLNEFAQRLDKDNVEIVFYCSNYMCSSSGFACKKLTTLGFKNVWAYEAGMAEWYQEGLPVEGSCKGAYLSKPNIKPEHEPRDVKIITTQELHHKFQQELKSAA